MHYAGRELEAMGEALNYERWIMEAFRPHLGARVLELGGGIGRFSRQLLKEPIRELVILEPAANLFPLLEYAVATDERARAVRGGDALLPAIRGAGSMDSVVCVNVLEHIQDDASALRGIAEVLRRGGRLLLFVPALKALYGSLDKAFGHHRRYGYSELAAKVSEAGLEIQLLRYFNAPGALAWLIAGRLFRRTRLSRRAVRLYDRAIVPVAAAVERCVRMPFGQSLLVIAERV